MARYALETIPDPSVDDALRDALGKLKGRPLHGRDRQSRRAPRRQGRRRDGQTAQRIRRRHGPGRRTRLGQHRHARGRQGPRSRTGRRVGRQSARHLRRSLPLCRGIVGAGTKRPVAGDLRPSARADAGPAAGPRGGPAGRDPRPREGGHSADARGHPRLGPCPDRRGRAGGHGTARAGGHRCAVRANCPSCPPTSKCW